MSHPADYRPGDEHLYGSPYYEEPEDDGDDDSLDAGELVDALSDLVCRHEAEPLTMVDGRVDTYGANASTLLVGMVSVTGERRLACADALVKLIESRLSARALTFS